MAEEHNAGGFAPAHEEPAQSSKFGRRIYQIISDPDGNFLYKERVCVVFFEAAVIIQSEQKVCCYQKAFQQVVVPKYKINGINISKSQVPVFVIFCGWVLIALSIALGFAYKINVQTGEAEEYIVPKVDAKGLPTGQFETIEVPPKTTERANFVLGIILLALGLIMVFGPYFNATYYVNLRLSRPKISVGGLTGLIAAFLPDPYSQSFRVSEMPDGNKLMDYCYGNLISNMDKMHALSHMVQDDISDIIKPYSLADVA
jgi:hypothetical protein